LSWKVQINRQHAFSLFWKEKIMYASVRKYQVDPASVSEIRRQVDEEFLPIVSDTPRFIAYYLVDSGGGAIATVSIFENQAGADESNRRAAEWVKGLASLIPTPPEITVGEVTVHKT